MLRRMGALVLGSLLLAAAPPSAQGQAALGAVGDRSIEGVIGAVSVPTASAAANITTRGVAPVAGLRGSRVLRPRLAITVSVAYGEARNARRDVYERPAGPTRTDTYDFRTFMALAGVEYAWPLGRAEGTTGLEAGWVREGWRVASHVDPANLAAPSSSMGGGAAAGARLGVRYPVGAQIALGGAVRVLGGAGSLEGNGVRVLPELGLRWRF